MTHTLTPGPGGLPFLTVKSARGRARVTAHGAQVCEWIPAGQAAPVLYLSPHAVFAPAKAIRGGIPICFPWFGAHPSDAKKPTHGFARTSTWTLTDATGDAAGDVVATFRLVADAATRLLWPADFVATLTVSLGAALTLTLEVANTSEHEIVYEAALHTYLAVGDVTRITVRGLERTRFLDKVDGMKAKVEGNDPITIAGEVDRVYLDTTAPCVIEDPVLARKIRIDKHGSSSTVVWNPGPDKGPAVPDIRDSWPTFVCVESANCAPHAVRLAPTEHHSMTTRLSID